MTKKECKSCIGAIELLRRLAYENCDKVISMLEQEPKTVVLDKIREEIEQTANEEQDYDKKWAKGLRYAVKIIDKYRREG